MPHYNDARSWGHGEAFFCHILAARMVGIKYIVGVDEAGRGPLAGPIAVGVVCIPSGRERLFAGIRDSKKLTEKQREKWFAKIRALQRGKKLRYGVALVGNAVIDKKGITAATRLGIKRLLRRLDIRPKEARLLLDGSLFAPREFIYQRTIIGGDDKVRVIAAASVVAKVKRDRKMVRLSKDYPAYGFDIHKGYGTKSHVEKIKKLGLSPLHRRGFCRGLFTKRAKYAMFSSGSHARGILKWGKKQNVRIALASLREELPAK